MQQRLKNGIVPRAIARSLRVQVLIALVLALFSLTAGRVAAYSSLLGSAVVFAPGLLFTVLVTGKIGQDSSVFLRTAVLAEFSKLALVAVFCAAVFIGVKPLAPGFFFLGMIGMVVAGRAGMTGLFRQ